MEEKKESLYIGKNDKADPSKNQPPIYISHIDKNGTFQQMASCWKTKSGKGYICKMNEGVLINFQDVEAVDREFEGEEEISDDDDF